jgi:hypothetical protein
VALGVAPARVLYATENAWVGTRPTMGAACPARSGSTPRRGRP